MHCRYLTTHYLLQIAPSMIMGLESVASSRARVHNCTSRDLYWASNAAATPVSDASVIWALLVKYGGVVR
jgi:hypothetical protein